MLLRLQWARWAVPPSLLLRPKRVHHGSSDRSVSHLGTGKHGPHFRFNLRNGKAGAETAVDPCRAGGGHSPDPGRPVAVEDEEETIEEEEARAGAVDHQAELSHLAQEGRPRRPAHALGNAEFT